MLWWGLKKNQNVDRKWQKSTSSECQCEEKVFRQLLAVGSGGKKAFLQDVGGNFVSRMLLWGQQIFILLLVVVAKN